jgi:uncharacterized membrane protein
MNIRQCCGFGLGLLGTWFMWQVGVGLAHFIHSTYNVTIPAALMDPAVTLRISSALAAFLAGLAALTERKGGAWLAGLSTFMFACVALGVLQGRHDISVWRDDYLSLSILTILFLTLVVLRRNSDEIDQPMHDPVEAS